MKVCAISVWKCVGFKKSFDIQADFELNCCDNNNGCCDFKILLVLLKTGGSEYLKKKIPPAII